MSRTYIGPFGRYLPIVDENEPFQPEHEEISLEDQPKMTTYQLPPPPTPTRLQFGTDLSPRFIEPTRYNTMSDSRPSYDPRKANSGEHPRRMYREQLPSVSQLLTPGSQSSVPNSPFSPQHSPDLSETRHTYPSSHRNAVPERLSQTAAAYPNQGVYNQMPFQAQQGEILDPRNHNFPINAQSTPFPSPYSPRQETNAAHYPTYAASSRSPYAPHPPLVISPNAPAQFQHAQPASYDLSSPSSIGFDQNRQDAGVSIKPLPRVVGEQDIPGEGPCWLYEDGSICRKVIDGEEVNAQWGITKAGKPRKRLAIACTTCREKKIKCDPGDPKCVQCDKFGRECRFTTAFRSQHNRPDSPSYDLQARTSPMTTRKESRVHSGLMSPRSSAEQERMLVFKRGSSPGELLEIKHNADCRPSLMRDSTPLKKRRHTPTSIKTENEFEEQPPKTEEKTARDLEYHSWKLTAVEVECRHCSERKLLPCSYLKLSPTLVQSGILPRIPRLEGESACPAKPKKPGNSDQWRISQTATCA